MTCQCTCGKHILIERITFYDTAGAAAAGGINTRPIYRGDTAGVPHVAEMPPNPTGAAATMPTGPWVRIEL